MGDTQRGAGVSCELLSSWLACDAETFRFFGSLGSSETKSTGKQRARKVYTSCWQREEMRDAKGTLQKSTQFIKKIAQAVSKTAMHSYSKCNHYGNQGGHVISAISSCTIPTYG